MSPNEVDEWTLWQYTAMLAEHNARIAEQSETVAPWTPEEYEREVQALRERGDPQIQV